MIDRIYLCARAVGADGCGHLMTLPPTASVTAWRRRALPEPCVHATLRPGHAAVRRDVADPQRAQQSAGRARQRDGPHEEA